jgi:hypothetical protein
MVPRLDEPAIFDASDADSGERHLFAGRFETHSIALVSATHRAAHHHFVAFRHLVLPPQKLSRRQFSILAWQMYSSNKN